MSEPKLTQDDKNTESDKIPVITVVEIEGTTYEINSYFNHAVSYIDLVKNRLRREMEID